MAATATLLDERYTLSDEQRDSFAKRGFLLVTDLLDADSKAAIKAWSDEVQRWPNVPGKWMPYEETKADGTVGLCRTENFANYVSVPSRDAPLARCTKG